MFAKLSWISLALEFTSLHNKCDHLHWFHATMFIFIYRENNPWNVSMNIVPVREMIPYQTFSKLGIWIHLKGVGGLNYVLTFKQDHSCFWAWNDPVF